MNSEVRITNNIELPLIEGEFSMIPFYLDVPEMLYEFQNLAKTMLKGIKAEGVGYFTIHGKKLLKADTLRRGGPHTDGSYELATNYSGGSGGGNGWKIGENGPATTSEAHRRLYNATTGGIVIASNFESCLGWTGEFEGHPGVGGDCSHITLNEPFTLDANRVYYGNNHFIHESLPVNKDVHRVFARITLPQTHKY